MLCAGIFIIYALDTQFKSLIVYPQFLTKCCVTDVYSEKITALEVLILLDLSEKVMKMVDENIIFKSHTFLTRTVELALKFLQSNIQLGAYHVLKHAMPKLVEQNKNTMELKNFDLNTLNIKKLEETFQSTCSVMNAF